MPRPTLLLAITLLAASASPVHLDAWGAQGHRMAATCALSDLPPAVGAWFLGQEDTLPDHANDPDQWKGNDPLEHPRHYLNSEIYGGPALVPLDENAAMALLGGKFQNAGQVPWVILERVRGLTQAFAGGDPAQVAFQASILSHYVADLNVPLHTTLNHDGELTGQKGVHHHWEAGLLQRIVDNEGWTPEARLATLGSNPATAPWAWLKESFSLVPGVLADDLTAREDLPRGATADAMGHRYWKTFVRLQESHVKEQMNLSAQRTAQMIIFAWISAGSPPAPQPSR